MEEQKKINKRGRTKKKGLTWRLRRGGMKKKEGEGGRRGRGEGRKSRKRNVV